MLRLFSTLFGRRTTRFEGVASRPGAVRRFLQDVRGAAALEFGFIAPPFFLLLFSMFEVGLTYTADAVLQSAVTDTARKIRTGQVQSAGLTREQFRKLVCDEINILLSCDQRLQIDVRRFSAFTGAGFTNPLDEAGNFRNDYKFEPGSPCDVVLVRAFYAWDPVTPGLGDFMANMSGGSRLLQGTAAVRNEPFESAGPVC